MEKTITTIIAILISSSVTLAQWTSPGSNPFTSDNPEIERLLPNLVLDISLSTGHGGLTFQSSGTDESRFAYRPATNKFIMGPTALENDAILTIDLDADPITDTTDGYFILGEPTGLRMAMDKNDIQVKNSVGNTGLFLNRYGGNVNIGDDGLVWDNSSKGVAINSTDALDELDVNGDISLSDGDGIIKFRENSTVKARIKWDGDILAIANLDTASGAGNIVLNSTNDIKFKTNSSVAKMIVKEDGKVGIGTVDPAFELQVEGDVDITGEFSAASDRRLKKNIATLQNASSIISALNPVSYYFKSDAFPGKKLTERKKMGLIAQEVEEILPNLVSEAGKAIHISGEEIDIKSVNYMELIPLLIKGMQEQQEQIVKLTNEIEHLKGEGQTTAVHHINNN